MTNTTPQLPETRKPVDNVLDAGTEIERYEAIVLAYEFEAARVAGVSLVQLAFREYGDRLMWRLTFSVTKPMSNDEAKRIAWTVLTRCFGAFKPEFFKPDNGEQNQFVGVWFTNGARNAHRAISF